ncbi:MAG: hypothetical protein BWX97_02308 [Firmicutes bacterium ADurb.Bin146]|nr:MAG: hypothetical protein BWX97_02308 [Firmicutes bacterium ADurb.Bin146]
MKKAFAVILVICIMYGAVNVNASDDAHSKISQTYLEKEELSIWEALGLCLNGYEIQANFYTSLKEDITNREGIYRTALEYAKLIILLKQDGKNPKDFYGYNLVSMLQEFKNIDKSGINGVIFSIFALIDENTDADTLWTKEKLLVLLLEYQNEDGGFPLAKGWGSDNDLSAMAVTALSYFPKDQKAVTALNKALSFLSSKLDSDGFMYYQNSDSSENLSQVIIALSTAGIPLNDERFVRQGKTLYDTLIKKYMTNEYLFKHSADQNANNIATEQAYLALTAINIGYVYAKKEDIIEPSQTPVSSPEITHEPVQTEKPEQEEKLVFSDEGMIFDEYYEDIRTAYARSLIVGDGFELRPLDNLTRAEACVLLYKAAGIEINIFIPRFKDVQFGSWYSKYIIACYLNGIIAGRDLVFFEPYSYISAPEFVESINKITNMDIEYKDNGYITRQTAISLIVQSLYRGDD